MDNSEKTKHGGARIGSGRKKTTVKTYGFNASQEVVDILENVPDKTKFITEAVMALAKSKGLI